MKGMFLLAVLVLPLSAVAGFGSQATTSVEKIDSIDIQLVNGADYYFKTEDGNWSSSNCPNAAAGFIKQSDIGAETILAVALTAKASNTAVQLRGVCGNGAVGGTSDGYLYINYLTLDPK